MYMEGYVHDIENLSQIESVQLQIFFLHIIYEHYFSGFSMLGTKH